MFELGLKCCFMNMMKWLFKVVPVEQTLQGRLRTHTTALYHPGSVGREKRVKENGRDSEWGGENCEAQMQNSRTAAGMSAKRETWNEKVKKRKNKPKFLVDLQIQWDKSTVSSISARSRVQASLALSFFFFPSNLVNVGLKKDDQRKKETRAAWTCPLAFSQGA